MSALPTSRLEHYSYTRRTLSEAAYGELFETITAGLYGAVIQDGDTVLDCGANVGRHSIPMAQLVGASGRVHSFEVSPVVLPWLKDRLAQAGVADRVTLHEVAVARASGAATFYFTQGGAYGMSGLKPRHLNEELRKTVQYVPTTVRACRLDDELAGLTRVSFIKLDLEGGEFDALVGGQGILRNHRPALVFENGRSESAADYGYSLDDFFGFFAAVGYSLYDAFGYGFGREDWTRGSMPWQFVALPSERPWGAAFQRAVVEAQRKAGLTVGDIPLHGI